jgi:cell wall-associated NlpC family hydrolase
MTICRIYPVAFALAIGMLALSGCASSPQHPVRSTHSQSLFSNSTKQTKTQQRLARYFRHWKHTPYKYGGLSKKGIDCSGFVYVTYRDVFTRKVPRSTKLLARSGKYVSRNHLRLGDLVFFQTGKKQRHVGIYIGHKKFIHASTSSGVMQSRMDNPYWRHHYRTARRILHS